MSLESCCSADVSPRDSPGLQLLAQSAVAASVAHATAHSLQHPSLPHPAFGLILGAAAEAG